MDLADLLFEENEIDRVRSEFSAGFATYDQSYEKRVPRREERERERGGEGKEIDQTDGQRKRQAEMRG